MDKNEIAMVIEDLVDEAESIKELIKETFVVNDPLLPQHAISRSWSCTGSMIHSIWMWDETKNSDPISDYYQQNWWSIIIAIKIWQPDCMWGVIGMPHQFPRIRWWRMKNFAYPRMRST